MYVEIKPERGSQVVKISVILDLRFTGIFDSHHPNTKESIRPPWATITLYPGHLSLCSLSDYGTFEKCIQHLSSNLIIHV
jgi:hypothetical protein